MTPQSETSVPEELVRQIALAVVREEISPTDVAELQDIFDAEDITLEVVSAAGWDDVNEAIMVLNRARRNGHDTAPRLSTVSAPTTGPAPPPSAQVPTVDDMLTVADVLALPPPPQLVGDWLDLGMLATMPGKYGSLKTFAAFAMGLSVATGEPWLDQPIHQTGRVLFCALEGAYSLGPRLAGWLESTGRSEADANDFLVWDQRLNLLDPSEVDAFATFLARWEPVLVIIDTLSKATPGADENSKPDTSKAYTALDDFRQASGGTIVTLHHTGHSASGRGRGFSGFEDDLDVVLAIEGQWKDGPVELVSQKQKARENPPPMWLQLETTTEGNPFVAVADGPGKGGNDEANVRSLVLAMIERYPGQLIRTDLTNKASRGHVAARAEKVREVVNSLEQTGEIKFERGRRDGDRQTVDLIYPGRIALG